MTHSDQESWLPIYFSHHGYLARRVVEGRLTQRRGYFPYPQPIDRTPLPPIDAASQPDELDNLPF